MDNTESADEDRNVFDTTCTVKIMPEQNMTNEDWTSLAWSLGMPAADTHKPNLDAQRFAYRVQRKQEITAKQILDHLGILVANLRKDHPAIRHKKSAKFRWDAVPDHSHFKFGLRAPQPGMVFGYRATAFSLSHLDLQTGTIANEGDKPQHMERIAQIVAGVFWPFLIIEIHNDSMVSAQRACSTAAATCNNALAILANLTSKAGDRSHLDSSLANPDSSWGWTTAGIAFSISIHDKIAYLNAHTLRNGTVQNFNTVKAYRLYDAHDVECMMARIQSILVWADYIRLQSIRELLNVFSRSVPPPQPPKTRPQLTILTPPDSKNNSPTWDRLLAQKDIFSTQDDTSSIQEEGRQQKNSTETALRQTASNETDASMRRDDASTSKSLQTTSGDSRSRLRKVFELRLGALARSLPTARPRSPPTPTAMRPEWRF